MVWVNCLDLNLIWFFKMYFFCIIFLIWFLVVIIFWLFLNSLLWVCCKVIVVLFSLIFMFVILLVLVLILFFKFVKWLWREESSFFFVVWIFGKKFLMLIGFFKVWLELKILLCVGMEECSSFWMEVFNLWIWFLWLILMMLKFCCILVIV